MPQITGETNWTLAEIDWKIVGEIKIPVEALNALMIYYISEISGGFNVVAAVEKYIRENPDKQRKDLRGLSYGPSKVIAEY